MKKFFTEVKAALSKSDIYTKPEHNTVAKALTYIAILILVISAIRAIFFGVLFFPVLGDLSALSTRAIDKYPADLVLTLKNQKLSTNREAPYILPSEASDTPNTKAFPYKNYVVIDTSKSLDLKTFKTYNTSVLITADGYMSADNRGSVKIQTFKKFPDYVLSKSVVTGFGTKIHNVVANFSWLILGLFILFMWVILSIGTYIGTLFLSLVGTLVTFGITRIKKHTLTFSQLFALSVYAYTIVLLYGLVNSVLHWPGWIGLVLFVGMILFVEKKA